MVSEWVWVCSNLASSGEPPPPCFTKPPTTEGKGEEEGEGIEGVERMGEETFLVIWPRRLSALNPPLGFLLVFFTNFVSKTHRFEIFDL